MSAAARRLPSLRAYVVIVLLAASVPLAAMLAYQLFGDMQQQQLRLHEGLQRSTAVLANAVESELTTTIEELTVLAGALQRTAPAERAAVLRHALQEPRRAHWQSLFLRGPDGPLIASGSARGLPPRNGSAEGVTVSNLVGDAAALGTMVEVPVVGKDGGADEARQTLGAWIDASQWQRLVHNAGAPPSGFLALVGGDGRLIARSDAPQLAGRAVGSAALTAMAGDTDGTQRAELAEGGLTYGAWQTLPLSGWGIGARVLAAPIDRAQRRALLTALATTTACLLLGVALASLLARRITEPLIALASSGPALAAPPLVREIAQLRDALGDCAGDSRRIRGRICSARPTSSRPCLRARRSAWPSCPTRPRRAPCTTRRCAHWSARSVTVSRLRSRFSTASACSPPTSNRCAAPRSRAAPSGRWSSSCAAAAARRATCWCARCRCRAARCRRRARWRPWSTSPSASSPSNACSTPTAACRKARI